MRIDGVGRSVLTECSIVVGPREGRVRQTVVGNTVAPVSDIFHELAAVGLEFWPVLPIAEQFHVNKETMGNLKFSYLGNPATHMPGHFGMSMPQGMAGLPGVTAMAAKMM